MGAEVIAVSVQEDPVPIQEAAQRRSLFPEIQGVPECPVLREEVGPIVVPVICAVRILLREHDRLVQHQEKLPLPFRGSRHPAGEFRLKEPPQLPIPDGPDGLPVAVLPPQLGIGVIKVSHLLVQEGQFGGVLDLSLGGLLGQVVPEAVRLRRLGVRQEFPVHPEGAAQDAF